MVLPFIKVFSILTKTAIKPVVNVFKKSYIQRVRERKNFGIGVRSLMVVGRGYHRLETRVNRMFINYKDKKSYIKDISNEVAVERGVEFLAEMFVYTFLIGLSFYEIAKSIESAHKKEKAAKDAMEQLTSKVAVLEHQQSQIDVEGLNSLTPRLEGIESSTKAAHETIERTSTKMSDELNRRVEEQLKSTQAEVLKLLSDIKTKCSSMEEESRLLNEEFVNLKDENSALKTEIQKLRAEFGV